VLLQGPGFMVLVNLSKCNFNFPVLFLSHWLCYKKFAVKGNFNFREEFFYRGIREKDEPLAPWYRRVEWNLELHKKNRLIYKDSTNKCVVKVIKILWEEISKETRK
jgi:hypothetical protein